MVRQPCLLARISILAPELRSAYHKPPSLDPPKCSFFLLEPSFASAKRQFPPAGKTKTGKMLLFSDFHKVDRQYRSVIGRRRHRKQRWQTRHQRAFFARHVVQRVKRIGVPAFGYRDLVDQRRRDRVNGGAPNSHARRSDDRWAKCPCRPAGRLYPL